MKHDPLSLVVHTLIMLTVVMAVSMVVGVAHAAIIAPTATADVNGNTVRLSDIFPGVTAERDVEIALAPAPCRQMTYDMPVLRRLSQKYNLGWESQTMQEATVVRSGCTRIPAANITSAVAERFKENGVRGEVEVVFDNPVLDITLPSDQSAQFTLNNFSTDQTSRRFRVTLLAGNGMAVPLAGRVVVKRVVPVLAHRLQAGDVIAANDLTTMAVPEEQVSLAVVVDEKQIIGKEVRRDTDAETLLYVAGVSPPRLVTRGSLVTLKIETPFMTLTAQGKALQDGTEGETVRVLNTQSNRNLEGKVESAGVVRVQIAQKYASVQ